MRSPLYVIVPRLDDSGLVKGAVALCNGLSPHFCITLIALKGIATRSGLNPKVTVIPLDFCRGFRQKYSHLKKILSESFRQPCLISMGFSADLMTLFFRSKGRIVSSIRGHLTKSYPKKYGLAGHLLARLHFLMLRRFHTVVVLSEAMKRQAERFNLKKLAVVGNFIDEERMERYRTTLSEKRKEGEKTVLFVGSFTKRKRADLLIEAARWLRDQKLRCQITLMGDGPLRGNLEKLVTKYQLEQDIRFLGHLSDPYQHIQQADLLVLPSESEGVSRAALEALFFGVPCILRNVDGNAEIIQEGVNGYLFHSNEELGPVIASALLKRSLRSAHNLIPAPFRYHENIEKLSHLIRDDYTN